MTPNTPQDAPAPAPKPSTPSTIGAYLPGILAVALPVGAFVLAWLIAGKIPFSVPSREWGTWFFIGPLMGIAGIAGFVFVCKAFVRKKLRSLAIAGLVLNPTVVLIAWAGLFG